MSETAWHLPIEQRTTLLLRSVSDQSFSSAELRAASLQATWRGSRVSTTAAAVTLHMRGKQCTLIEPPSLQSTCAKN